jgi:cell division septal protein FtsQ
MAGRKESTSRADLMEILRWVYRGAIVLAILAGGLYAFHEVEQRLISDPRFLVAGPPEYGMDPPNMRIEGAAFASRKEILGVFAPDFGKSLYLLPVAERREQLRKIEWVKDATVARFWPNQVLVRVDERVPVALLRADEKRGWLVDAEGVLLRIPPQSSFAVPVVKGVSGKDTPAQRSERIKRMLRVIKDSGRHGERFTMVNVADMDNVKVTLPVGDRKLTLWLGGRNFLSRLDGFESSYPRVWREMPNDTVFDLRLDGRISNVPETGSDVKGE